MAKIKVLIADDSVLMRMLVTNMLNECNDIEVIGSATNGLEAVQQAQALNPDVLLLDLVMPDYDGLYALKELEKKHPLPTIILSASTQAERYDVIMEAMALGAFDYIAKPKKNRNGNAATMREGIVSKIRAAAHFDVKKLGGPRAGQNMNPHSFPAALPYDAIVIGSSTGGPTALEKLIKNLPSNLPIPIIIAQHIPANFIEPLARRLNSLSPLPVVVAKIGDPILPGRIYIAPGLHNTGLERKSKDIVCFTKDEKRYREFNHPSVNALFHGAAQVYGKRCIALQLTGMGRDGVAGLEELHKAGAYIIAQDKESCIVFGMPGEAVKRGLTYAEVSITQMGGYVVGCLG